MSEVIDINAKQDRALTGELIRRRGATYRRALATNRDDETPLWRWNIFVHGPNADVIELACERMQAVGEMALKSPDDEVAQPGIVLAFPSFHE